METLLRPTKALDTLASQINASHENVIACVRKSLEHAKECGERLLKAKSQLGHGNWLDWLEDNITCSDRTAQNYMRIAEAWDKLKEKTQETADLTVEQALRLLTEQKQFEKKLTSPKIAESEQPQTEYTVTDDGFEVEDDETGEKTKILSMSPRPKTDDCVVTLTQVVQRLEHLIDQVNGDKDLILELISDARTALDQIEQVLA